MVMQPINEDAKQGGTEWAALSEPNGRQGARKRAGAGSPQAEHSITALKFSRTRLGTCHCADVAAQPRPG